MTLQNGLLTNDAAYLWSDTGHYQFDGTFGGHGPKLFTGAGFPFALIHSGMSDVGDRVIHGVGAKDPKNLGELLQIVREGLETLNSTGGRCAGGERFLIASYDGRPRLTLMADTLTGGYPACEPLHVRKMFSGDSPEMRAAVPETLTPENMMQVIHAQHSWDIDFHDRQPVSGNIMRAKVWRGKVEVSIVAMLPDPTNSTTLEEFERVQEGASLGIGTRKYS